MHVSVKCQCLPAAVMSSAAQLDGLELERDDVDCDHLDRIVIIGL